MTDRSRLSASSLPPALVAVLAVVVLAAGLATVALRGRSSSSAAPPPTSTTVTSTAHGTAPPGSTSPSTEPPPASPVSPAQAALVRRIQDQVATVRGLSWKGPLDLEIVSKPELARRIREVEARDLRPERVAGDGDALRLLRLIPRDLDYPKLVSDLLAEQVLGFYDPETKKLVVGDEGGGEVSAATKGAIAHEMLHALTDQHFDFGTRTEALDDADRQEELAGLSAVLEGDAVLLQTLWAERYLSVEEQIGMAFGGASSSAVLQRAPPFIREALYFPYTEGLDFVKRRHRAGGFRAVDDLYRRPPTSTEQVLHPSRYEADEGWTAPPLPDVARATGCPSVRTGNLGEFVMAEVLSSQLRDDEAERTAEGWDGDTFAVVRCGGALGLVDRWQVDPGVDAGRLADGLRRWARAWSGTEPGPDGRFSGRTGAGRVVSRGDRVDLVLADDAGLVDRLATALGH